MVLHFRDVSCYHDPTAYDLAFAFRDFEREVDFLLSVAPPAVTAAVELAAGSARHARALAARGVTPFAVEREPGSVAWLSAHAPEVRPVLADLRDFRLPQPVELAFCPLSGFAYLLDDDSWHAALDAVHDALTPGGALVLELAPHDARRAEADTWTMTEGDATVVAEAGACLAAAGGVFTWELRLTLRRGDGVSVSSGSERQRDVSAAQVARLLRGHGGFGPMATYDGYDRRRRYRGGPSLVCACVKRG